LDTFLGTLGSVVRASGYEMLGAPIKNYRCSAAVVGASDFQTGLH